MTRGAAPAAGPGSRSSARGTVAMPVARGLDLQVPGHELLALGHEGPAPGRERGCASPVGPRRATEPPRPRCGLARRVRHHPHAGARSTPTSSSDPARSRRRARPLEEDREARVAHRERPHQPALPVPLDLLDDEPGGGDRGRAARSRGSAAASRVAGPSRARPSGAGARGGPGDRTSGTSGSPPVPRCQPVANSTRPASVSTRTPRIEARVRSRIAGPTRFVVAVGVVRATRCRCSWCETEPLTETTVPTPVPQPTRRVTEKLELAPAANDRPACRRRSPCRPRPGSCSSSRRPGRTTGRSCSRGPGRTPSRRGPGRVRCSTTSKA